VPQVRAVPLGANPWVAHISPLLGNVGFKVLDGWSTAPAVHFRRVRSSNRIASSRVATATLL
jgi:hypothetical protein